MRRLALIVLVALVAAAPADAGSAQVLYGKHLFGRYCVSCHGMNGSGVTTPKSIGAGPGREQAEQQAVAPSLQGVGALAADFYLRTGYMPLQRLGLQPRRSRVLFDDAQIRALTAYVASLGAGPKIPQPQPQRGNLSQGEHLFADHCAGCHQIVAEGGYVTGAVPPPLEDATATQIAEAVRIGPYVMPRFTKKAISNAQLNSLIAYVQYTKHPDDAGGWALGHIGPVPEGLVTWFIAIAALIFTCMLIGKRYRSE
ncbi:MAG TPA: c-type cytochrome [Gaiellaceae bacterium]|nr:c-type cytochrome [Gaiellaceae bacterium]